MTMIVSGAGGGQGGLRAIERTAGAAGLLHAASERSERSGARRPLTAGRSRKPRRHGRTRGECHPPAATSQGGGWV
jgi:hypothetical protein